MKFEKSESSAYINCGKFKKNIFPQHIFALNTLKLFMNYINLLTSNNSFYYHFEILLKLKTVNKARDNKDKWEC